MTVTNEFGQIEQRMVAKVTAELFTAVPTLRMVAAVPEDLADEFVKAFPACIISFGGAHIIDKVATSVGPQFSSRAEGRYVAMTYSVSGKSEDQSRYGETGIYELEKLVRVSLMGWAPLSQVGLNHNPLFWTGTDPAVKLTTRGGSGVLKMRTTFAIDQLVTATAT